MLWQKASCALFKCEEVYLKTYRDLDDAALHIQDFLERIYNCERSHSSLDYLSPAAYEALTYTNSCGGAGLSFSRHEKIYQSDGFKRELNGSFNSLADHRSDESSTGYSFMSCSPAELMSASPVLQSFSLNLAVVKPSATNRNCPSFTLSQPKGSTPDGPGALPKANC